MNKKQKIGVGISLASLLGVVALSLLAKPLIPQGTSDMLVVAPVEGLKIIKQALSDDGNTLEVTYKVLPVKPSDVHFNSYISWNEENNPDFESADWYEGKNPEDYMSYTLDEEADKITFTCLAPFGTQMIFHLSCQENPAVTASMKIDYARSEIKKANYKVINSTLEDGKKIEVEKVLPEYSIGTTGERPSDKFQLLKSFSSMADTPYLNLFVDPITVGIYSQEWSYQGEKYTDKDSLKVAMSQKVEEYIHSLIGFKGEAPAFSFEHFKSLLTYQYPVYSYGQGNIVYSTDATPMYQFLKRYQKVFETGNGFSSFVRYDNKNIGIFYLDFNISTELIESIDFEGIDEGIVFNRK